MAGGPQEAQVIAHFKSIKRNFNYGHESDSDGCLPPPQYRNSYPREAKLEAIYYALHTWVLLPDGSLDPISRYQVALNLSITPTMLKNWISAENKIRGQKRGTKRSHHAQIAKFPEHDRLLNEEFLAARALGRRVDHRWFYRHAKSIFRSQYPLLCMRSSDTNQWKYFGMKFSNRWFQAFRQRHRISLRCRTKRAQHTPDHYRPYVLSFMRFNRRNTIVAPSSDCGKQRAADVEASRIGRFLPCNISNMDQTPLPFESSSTGRTYDQTGNKTVMVKGGPSGWDKRKCTLQTTLHADGIAHTRPLLMFAGKEGTGNRNRQGEMKQYHKGVDVIFNPKAYCNSKAMLGWLKNQFRWGTPYPLADREPRLLVLDSFAPHKNKGISNLACICYC
jgi:hypothetical protein